MAEFDLKKAQQCNQRDKNVVYGYMRMLQAMFPSEQNSYYIIVKSIQDIILLYFCNLIPSKILTEDECFKLYQLFHNRGYKEFRALFGKKSFNAIYDSSKHGLDRQICIDKVHDRSNILVIIQSESNDVFGGFTSVGWKTEINFNDRYLWDNQAFIFSIRSSKGWQPQLSHIFPTQSQYAVYHFRNNYCWFGKNGVIAIHKFGNVYTSNESSYESFPRSYYLLGGKSFDKVKAVECYQLN